jgi:L,D-transpeptidase catalytic domain
MRLLKLIFGAGVLGLLMAAAILVLAPPPAPRAATLTMPGDAAAHGAGSAQLALLQPETGAPRVYAPPLPRPPAPATRFARALHALWRKVDRRFPARADAELIVVDLHTETLYLLRRGRIAADWPVSTSRLGIDQRADSDGTPIGVFRVARKLGTGLPPGAVLRDQAPTGRTVAPVRRPDDPAASHWITTRILWLSGQQPGWNEGGDDDTYLRHIYIHGTANLGMLGTPASAGCVQMAPRAVITLYRAVPVGTPVLITPGTGAIAAIPGPAMG